MKKRAGSVKLFCFVLFCFVLFCFVLFLFCFLTYTSIEVPELNTRVK